MCVLGGDELVEGRSHLVCGRSAGGAHKQGNENKCCACADPSRNAAATQSNAASSGGLSFGHSATPSNLGLLAVLLS
jgi:hypothetical protein